MSLGAVLRIARWEATAGVGGLDRRTVVAALVVLTALAALAPAAAGSGGTPDAGIYRVGVAAPSPYHAPAAADQTITVVEPDPGAFNAGDMDVLIRDGWLRAHDTRKGRAAAAAFRSAVERYNDRLMQAEPDRAAAFPVSVELRYVERDVGLLQRRGTAGNDGGASTPGSTSSTERTTTSSEPVGSDTPATDGGDAIPSGGQLGISGPGALLGEASGTPSEISPPFPFVSLVLAFAFVVPMNFVIQAYASSVLAERTNRRGELLLVAPIPRWAIVAGKTLPYFAAMVVIAAATALVIGGGLVSLLAVVPLALLFLSFSFLAGLLARSHKELTFVLVTVSVVVTTYAFVPAIFTQVHPIASISPLTLVVRDLEGSAVSLGAVAFSTIPVLVAAGVVFALGAGIYREEDLFTQRPVGEKVLDALAVPVRGPRSAAILSALSIPFVFLAELLAIAVLFVLPVRVGLPALLLAVAAIEEVAKSVHVLAGFERGRYHRSLRTAAVVGAWSGAGFFVGEKAAAVAQLVGLLDLDLGRAAFGLGAGLGGASSPPVLALLLVAPLGLHAVTASMSAAGTSRGGRWYAVGLLTAVIVHAAYNFVVVTALG